MVATAFVLILILILGTLAIRRHTRSVELLREDAVVKAIILLDSGDGVSSYQICELFGLVAMAHVYLAIERLEKKGIVASRYVEGQPLGRGTIMRVVNLVPTKFQETKCSE